MLYPRHCGEPLFPNDLMILPTVFSWLLDPLVFLTHRFPVVETPHRDALVLHPRKPQHWNGLTGTTEPYEYDTSGACEVAKVSVDDSCDLIETTIVPTSLRGHRLLPAEEHCLLEQVDTD